MSLRKIEYDDFVVERKRFPGVDPYWAVSIHPHSKHLFKQSYGGHINEGSQPGWMAALKFATAEEAVEFGLTLVPIIEAARTAYEAHNAAFKQMINVAHKAMVGR